MGCCWSRAFGPALWSFLRKYTLGLNDINSFALEAMDLLAASRQCSIMEAVWTLVRSCMQIVALRPSSSQVLLLIGVAWTTGGLNRESY